MEIFYLQDEKYNICKYNKLVKCFKNGELYQIKKYNNDNLIEVFDKKME